MLAVKVVRQTNIFDRRSAVVEVKPWTPEATIESFVTSDVDREHTMAVLDGRRVKERDWDRVAVGPRSELIFTTIPEGVEIALAIGLTGVLAYVVGFAINLALAFGISMLAQKFIGGVDQGDLGESQTYTWGAIKTTTRNGQAKPVVYGEHRKGGHTLSAFPKKNQKGDTVLRLLLGLAEGPVQSVAGFTSAQNGLTGDDLADIHINGTEADQLEDVKAWIRLGDNDDEPIPGFDETIALVDEGTALDKNVAIEVTSQGTLESFELFLLHPAGVYSRSKRKGKLRSETVSYRVRWKVSGAGSWEEEETVTWSAKKTAPFSTIYRNDNPGLNHGEPVQIDIEVTKLNADDDYRHFHSITWVSTLEITRTAALGYPLTAKLALEIPAQQEANNTVPAVTVTVQGKKVWQWDPDDLDPATTTWTHAYSSNPSHCLHDWITNKRYGGGDVFTPCDPDLGTFDAFRQYCNELVDDLTGTATTMKRWECDLVIDEVKEFWAVASQIAMVGRAQILIAGRIVKVKIERPSSPVQLFTTGNIIDGSLSIQYLDPADRANYIEGQYLNGARDYAHDMVPIEDRLRITDSTVPVTKETIQLYGMTKTGRVARQVQYLLNLGRLGVQAIQFEAFADAVLVEPGDVFAFQHDVAQWQTTQGGRMLAASGSTTAYIDNELAIAEGEIWEIWVRTDGSGEDVVQNRRIINNPGTWAAGSELVIDTAWDASDEPARGDVYAVVNLTEDTALRQFRCVEATLERDLKRRISGIIYDAAMYDDTPDEFVVVDTDDDLIHPGRIPPNPTNLTLAVVGTDDPAIACSWEPADWLYDHDFKVYMRDQTENQATFSLEGRTGESGYLIEGVEAGHVYYVSVVPCAADRSACRDRTQGIIRSIEVTLGVEIPEDVTGMTASQSGAVLRVEWTGIDADDNDLRYYEVRRGDSWMMGRTIGQVLTEFLETTDWAIGAESIIVRAVSYAGRMSEKPPVATVTLANVPGESTDTSRDEVSLGWTGSKTSVQVNADDYLELSASQTTGTYEVTGITPSGGAGSYRVHINIQAEHFDEEVTWASSTDVWTDRTDAWDDANDTWDGSADVWNSLNSKIRSWEGLVQERPCSVAIEVRPNGTGSYLAYSPGVYNFTTIDYRLTLTRDDATNREFQLTQGIVTLSA